MGASRKRGEIVPVACTVVGMAKEDDRRARADRGLDLRRAVDQLQFQTLCADNVFSDVEVGRKRPGFAQNLPGQHQPMLAGHIDDLFVFAEQLGEVRISHGYVSFVLV